MERTNTSKRGFKPSTSHKFPPKSSQTNTSQHSFTQTGSNGWPTQPIMNFGTNAGSIPPAKRRIMVVAEPGREAAGALQWALSHTVLGNDDLILLHIDQVPSLWKIGNAFSVYFKRVAAAQNAAGAGPMASLGMSSSMGDSDGDFLGAMKAKCEQIQPKVKVQVKRVEIADGTEKDKAVTILAQSVILGVDLLVIGQHRRSTSLLSMLAGGTAVRETAAEFLIEHSECLCVGVQKKGQNAGYLLNTKTHKNFWLLA